MFEGIRYAALLQQELVNIYISFYISYGLSRWLGKETACNAGDTEDMSSVPGLGRSHGGRHGHLLQYYCLKNSMDGGAWQATVHAVAELDTTEAT